MDALLASDAIMNQETNLIAQEVKGYLESVDGQLLEHLGMVVEQMSPNQAVCQMVVREQMCNSHHYCQGGLIFAFADQAFAYACMSANRAGVTLSANIIFNKPAKLGDRLTATAKVLTEGKRTATCEVVVTNQAGVKIAHLQGVNYYVQKPVIE